MSEPVRTARTRAGDAPLPRLLKALALLAGLAALAMMAWVVAHRIAYPYDLEWMEGGMLCHALRLLHGQPIYVAPSVDFIPHLYTPLYPLVLAALGKLTGDVGYLSARLVSTGCFAAALAAGGLWAYREGGSRVAALCAMALPVVTFPQTGGFFDLARADSLSLLLTVLGAGLAFYGRGRHVAMAAAALLLVAGFFAKQTAAPLIVFVAAALLVTRRRTVLTFAVVGIVSFAFLVYLQNRASGGWFWTYIFRLHQGHAFFTRRAFVETPVVLLKLLGPALLIAVWAGLAQALGRPTGKTGPGLGYLLWLGCGGLFAACLGFGTQWAHTNAFIPGVFFPAIAIGAAAGRLVTRPPWNPRPPAHRPSSGGPSTHSGRHRRARSLRECLVWLLLLASLGLKARELHPTAHVPTAANRAAGDAVIAQLRSVPGDVLIPFHPFYAHLAGKPTFLHRMGVWDVRGTVAGPVHGLVAALQQQHFARIIFDDKVEGTWGDWPDVLLRYRITDRILGPPTFEGAKTAPALVLEPMPPPPPEPALAPAPAAAPTNHNPTGTADPPPSNDQTDEQLTPEGVKIDHELQ